MMLVCRRSPDSFPNGIHKQTLDLIMIHMTTCDADDHWVISSLEPPHYAGVYVIRRNDAHSIIISTVTP